MTGLAHRTTVGFGAGHGGWLLAAALLATAVLIALALASVRGVPAGRRVQLGALRVALVLAVVLLALRPELRRETLAVSAAPVAVVVDASGSMGVRDQEAGTTRMERTARWIRDNASLLDDLEHRAVVDWFVTADGALRTVSRAELASGKITAEGGTDLAAALRALALRYPGRPRPPVVLLSDGADHGALGRAVAAGQPVPQDVAAGGAVLAIAPAAGSFADVAIELAAHDPVGFVRTDVTVRARLSSTGLPPADIPVTLRQGDEVVSVKSVRVGGLSQPTADVTFTLSPTRVGEALYTLRVPVQDGEAVSTNNETAFSVRIVRDRIRVLQVVGRPSWDGRFLRELLKRDPGIDLISFFILRNAWDDANVADTSELSLIPFPVDELFDEKLAGFDLVIFQNMNLAPYGIQYHLPQLRKYVLDRGGALAVIGGDLAFGADYRSADLAAALPVETGPRTAWIPDDVRLRATPVGERHPVLRSGLKDGDVASWVASLLPVQGLVDGLVPSQGADVLLESADAAARPVLVVGEQGAGRVLVLATDGSWRFSLPMAGQGRSPRAYEQFWSSALRWLVRDERGALLLLEADRREVLPGESLELRARALTESYAADAGADVAFRVQDQAGATVLERTVKADADGVARLTFEPPAAGLFGVRAHSPRGEAGPLHVERKDASRELTEAAVNRAVLEALARATGGSVVSVGDRDPKLPSAPARDETVEAAAVSPLWRTWWAFGLVASLATVEWWLRRRSGLA